MVKCSFCGDVIPPATGKIFAKTDGRVLYFHGSKCEKNHRLGREGKDVKWTTTARKLRAK
ncbi:MAG: 50S ribosomal protein L24e [Candidatus Aenigmarchaeota archaeon]|nr:50S ribosomal protein L24e [Candidatus Aenigmarchaeota archaeon]